MREITFHAKMRCAERIYQISEEESYHYAKKHKDKISSKIWELLSKATLIYQNFLWDAKRDITCDIYKFKSFVLITGVNEGKVITLYNTNFDIQDEENRMFAEKALRKINSNNSLIVENKSKKKKITQHTQHLEFMIERLRDQIADLEWEMAENIDAAKEKARIDKVLKNESRELVQALKNGLLVNDSLLAIFEDEAKPVLCEECNRKVDFSKPYGQIAHLYICHQCHSCIGTDA